MLSHFFLDFACYDRGDDFLHDSFPHLGVNSLLLLHNHRLSDRVFVDLGALSKFVKFFLVFAVDLELPILLNIFESFLFFDALLLSKIELNFIFLGFLRRWHVLKITNFWFDILNLFLDQRIVVKLHHGVILLPNKLIFENRVMSFLIRKNPVKDLLLLLHQNPFIEVQI